MLRNFRALKMTVSLESVMHNNGQRDTGLAVALAVAIAPNLNQQVANKVLFYGS